MKLHQWLAVLLMASMPALADEQRDGNGKQSGSLSGTFVYDGVPPEPKGGPYSAYAKIDPATPIARSSDGRFSGTEMFYREFLSHGIHPDTTDRTLLVDRNGGVANVVVWVTSKEIPWKPAADLEQSPVKVTLIDGNYSPRIVVAVVNQPILLENHDPVPFNFHLMLSANDNSSNVMLAQNSIEKPLRVTFSKPEKIPYPFRADCGPWANGQLFIHANSYVTVSRPDGSFEIPDLPAGEWEFRAWHEWSGYVTHWPKGAFRQKIQPGENRLGAIKLPPQMFK